VKDKPLPPWTLERHAAAGVIKLTHQLKDMDKEDVSSMYQEPI
jgi:hypothetical protein